MRAVELNFLSAQGLLCVCADIIATAAHSNYCEHDNEIDSEIEMNFAALITIN